MEYPDEAKRDLLANVAGRTIRRQMADADGLDVFLNDGLLRWVDSDYQDLRLSPEDLPMIHALLRLTVNRSVDDIPSVSLRLGNATWVTRNFYNGPRMGRVYYDSGVERWCYLSLNGFDELRMFVVDCAAARQDDASPRKDSWWRTRDEEEEPCDCAECRHDRGECNAECYHCNRPAVFIPPREELPF